MKLTLLWLLIFLFSIRTQFAEAQNSYEPIHGDTGYDYSVKGELELECTHFLDQNDGNKLEGTYHIKSPVLLSFNRNDLKFLKARPKEFIGYVENPFIAYCGEPCSGGLIDIQQGGYQENENWMWINEHVKWWEGSELTELKAQGEIYPVLKVFFSIPDYSEHCQIGLERLQFRLLIAGTSDPNYHPTRKVVAERIGSKPGQAESLIDEETMKKLELVDPAVAAEMKQASARLEGAAPELSVTIGCGSFYGQDLGNAFIANNLVEADDAKKQAFESRFEQTYFKDLPRIDALKLIDYLIKPVGDYETPIVGSFSSASESGSEKASYNGTLRFYGNNIQQAKSDL